MTESPDVKSLQCHLETIHRRIFLTLRSILEMPSVILESNQMRVQGKKLVQIPLPEIGFLLQVQLQEVLAVAVPLEMLIHMILVYPLTAITQ
jgi:hypothetical protein